VAKISAYQVEYSPFDTVIELNGVLDACRELGITTIAYSPLGRGMLTGQYKSKDDFDAGDLRRLFPRFNDENFPKNLALVEKLETIGKTKGATAGQLALAWLLKQGEDIIPIPGTKKVKYLEENLGAFNLDITEDEIASIRQSVQEAGGLTGDRTVTAIDKTLETQDTPSLA
jgi:aryl-alcohol dehydrogenase-like predicted oxidoreductase